MRPVNLTTEYESNPIGVAARQPRFSWQLTGDGQQAGYEIEVSSEGATLWSTGRIGGAAQTLVPYGGPAVGSHQRCMWRVRVWTSPSEPTDWSEWATFELALLSPADWANASWISPPGPTPEGANRPSPMLRRDFTITETGRPARLSISALGIYDVEINGQPVSPDYLRPGFTAYRHRIQFQTYDVSKLLVEGRNAIGITLADGWWRGRVGVFLKPNNWGEQVAAIARLDIDGNTVVATDGSWTCTEGGTRAACLFHGETYDARREPDGWTTAGFDDHSWIRAQIIAGPTERLVPQVGPSVRAVSELPAERIFTTPAGETIVDFGVNIAGVVRFTTQGSAGDRVVLTHGETLNEAGNFTADTFGKARQQVTYTLRDGPGTETFTPRFTYHGFRYARVDEWPGSESPTAADFTALALSSDTPKSGSFESSHTGLNQLAENIERSQVGNFVEIPTDCPTREKAGWTGDIGVFARTGALNRNIAPLLTRWLGDVRADQLPDGRIPCVVPLSQSYNTFYMRPTHGAAAWADACVLVPWTLYQFYGDRHVLDANYATMQRWVGALEERARRNPWWAAINPRRRSDADHQHLIEAGFQWAEWLPPGETLTKNWLRGLLRPDPLVATGYYANTLAVVGQVAAVLGRDFDAERLEQLRARVVDAARHKLFESDGLPKRRDQIGLVAALAFDLVAEPHRTAAGTALATQVRADGSKLATGFTMTPLLCPTLVDTGHTKLAYDVLLSEDVPSWLYPISQGATSVWETWDAIAPDGTVSDVSQNHYAFGAIGEFLHRYVVGVDTDPNRPGYEHVHVQPVPDPAGRLTHARASLATLRGTVEAGWERRGNELAVQATIPPGSTATITAGSTTVEAGPGTHEVVG